VAVIGVETGAAAIGMAVIGAAIGEIMDSPVVHSSPSVDLVIHTIGVGIHLLA
jgi:energy-converting hydrogenase Eha subunit E